MASTYLSKTFASGNRRTWTYSGWVRKTKTYPELTSHEFLMMGGFGYQQGDYDWIGFVDTGQVWVRSDVDNASSSYYNLVSSAKHRDFGAWYHVCVAFDTTQATASDRIKIWVNGEQITSFQTESYPSLNFETQYNVSGNPLRIGSATGNQTAYWDGSMSHVHFIDGTAYDASTFGEFDATTGIWKPKTQPSVTYGTNGFFLKFENSGSMGLDSSGNANNFTVNGTLTQTVDTPSNVFATLNPLIPIGAEFSNGNLTHSTTSGSYKSGLNTLGVSSGKWYSEFKFTTDTNAIGIGVVNLDKGNINSLLYIGDNTNSVSFWNNSSNLYYNGTNPSWTGTSCVNGDIVGIALDLDNGFIYWHKNGTYMNSADPASGATGTGGFAVSNIENSDGTGTYVFGVTTGFDGTRTVTCNFGNGYFGTTPVSSATSDESGLGIFEYTVPSGYYALCTKNINEQEYD